MAASGSYSLTVQFRSGLQSILDLSIDIVLSETCGDALAHSWQWCYILRFIYTMVLRLAISDYNCLSRNAKGVTE